MADAPEQQELQAEGKPKSKLPIIIAAFVILLLIIGGVTMTLLNGGDNEDVLNSKKSEEVGLMYTFPEPFVVNLAFPDDQYLYNATITLEIGTQKGASETEAKKELGISEGDTSNKNKMPIVEEIITEILSSQTRSQVTSSAGRDKIRAQIKNQLNLKLDKAKITEVFLRGLVP